jgi:hypothetical protein
MGEHHTAMRIHDNVPLTLQLSENCQQITA